MEDKESIFDDTVFGKEKPKKEESFKDGFSSLGKGIMHIAKGLWHIFSKKFNMNLLVLLLLLILVFAVCYFIGFQQKIVEPQEKTVELIFAPGIDTSRIPITKIQSVIKTDCKSSESINISCANSNCTSCEVSNECPECSCEIKQLTKVYYQCLDGTMKDEKTKCNRLPMGLKTNNYAIKNGILLALNNVTYKFLNESEFDGVITLINLSIYDAAGYDIKPKVRVYLYESWNAAEVFKKVIDFNERILHSDKDSNEGITLAEPSNINFFKKQKTMKLDLIDIADNPDVVIVELIVKLDYS